jgi:hypothetical protein
MLKYKVVYVTGTSVNVADTGYFHMPGCVNNIKAASQKVLSGFQCAVKQVSNWQTENWIT